ncbi:MAG: ATP-binding protein [Chitinophagaceae bacterium]
MLFKDVVGQADLKKQLQHMALKGEIPHALLLAGEEGWGGMALAIAFAQFIFCTQRQNEDACGTCANCKKVSSLQHPDVHYSFPFEKADGKDTLSNEYFAEFRQFVQTKPYGTLGDWSKEIESSKQLNITAVECREILRKLSMRAYEGGAKVLILWKPEMLGNEGNIMLKFIEEPTANTYLLFVSENIEAILGTIRSRAQLMPLKRIPVPDIQEALLRKGISAEKALPLARLAEGSYHHALLLAEGGDDDFLLLTREWLNAIFQNKGVDLVRWADGLSSKNKDQQKNFLIYVLQLFEDTLRMKEMGAEHVLLLEQEARVADNLIQKGLKSNQIAELNTIINEAIYHLERNAHAKLLFHTLSLRTQAVLKPVA